MERGMWGTQERKDGWRSESPTAGQFILEMCKEACPLGSGGLHSVPGLFHTLNSPGRTLGSGSPARCSASPDVCHGVGGEQAGMVHDFSTPSSLPGQQPATGEVQPCSAPTPFTLHGPWRERELQAGRSSGTVRAPGATVQFVPHTRGTWPRGEWG